MRRLAAVLLLAASGCRDPQPDRPPVGQLAIETEGDAWIRIEGRTLLQAGLDSLSDPASLSLTHRGEPVALRVTPPDAATMFDVESIEFWAWSSHSLYQRTDAWILGPAESPLRVDETVPPPLPVEPALFGTVRVATETVYGMSARNGTASNWFWDFVFSSGTTPASKEFSFDVPSPAPDGIARVTAELHGYTYFDDVAPDHHVSVSLNGFAVADALSDGNAPLTVSASVPAAEIREGANALGLTLPMDTGAPFETMLLQAIEIEYPRLPRWTGAGTEQLLVATAGTLALDGFPDGTEAFDVTDRAHPRRVSRWASVPGIPPPPGGEEGEESEDPPDARVLQVSVARTARIAVVPPASRVAPLRIRALRGADPLAEPGTELVIIAPDALAPAADRLAQHRASTATARVLRWEHAIDHVGGGYADPATLRALVAGLSPAPKWVLLVGDASYDPRGVYADETGPESNLLPTTFDDTPFLETPSDNPIVAPATRERPTIAIGRLPVMDLGEADDVVDKIVAYETGAQADDVLLLADNAETSWEYELFVATSDEIAATVGQPFTTSKLYLAPGNAATVRASFFDALANGAAWVSFMGHGNFTRWATEGVLVDTDVSTLPERDVLPVVAAANCLTAHWTHPNSELRGLGERLLVEPRRGAVAVFASSALVYPEGQAQLTLALTSALLVDGEATLGDALLLAKQGLNPALSTHADILASWTLLGDPSMPLRRP